MEFKKRSPSKNTLIVLKVFKKEKKNPVKNMCKCSLWVVNSVPRGCAKKRVRWRCNFFPFGKQVPSGLLQEQCDDMQETRSARDTAL